MSNRKLPQRLANIPRAAERLIIVETGLKLYKIFNDIAFPGKTLAAVQEYAQIMGVVWIGQLTLRPLNRSKVAKAIGMPSSTALTKLKDLIDAGLLKRVGIKFYLADKLAKSTKATDELVKVFLEGADKIRKVQKLTKSDRKNAQIVRNRHLTGLNRRLAKS
jgi:hypothetical protein